MLSENYRNQLEQQGVPVPPSKQAPPAPRPVQPQPDAGQPANERFFGWKVTAVPKEGTELLDADQDPFFQQFAQQVCDHLAIAQLQGMNSVSMDDHQFAVTVLELPLKEGQNIPLPPDQALMFARPIIHQLVDGAFGGTIRLVEEQPPEQPDARHYGLAGWTVPED